MVQEASCKQLKQMLDATTTSIETTGPRFKIHDSVEANMGKEGYVAGTIKDVKVTGQHSCKKCPGGVAAYRYGFKKSDQRTQGLFS
jgi:hypothetical protein